MFRMAEKKIFRKSEVTKKKDQSIWLIINDNVYDVTQFLEEVRNYYFFPDSKLGTGQK